MKKIFILLIFLTSSLLFADKSNEYRNEFGLALGGNTGYGLMYKHNLNDTIAIKTTGGFFFDSHNYSYNLGVTLNRSLQRTEILEFYLSGGFLFTSESIYENGNEKDYRTLIGLGLSLKPGIFSVSFEFHQIFEKSVRSQSGRSEFFVYPMVGVTLGILL